MIIKRLDDLSENIDSTRLLQNSGPYARQAGDLTTIDAYMFHCDVTEVRGPIECKVPALDLNQ